MEIWVAIIGLVGTVATAAIGYLAVRHQVKIRHQMENEITQEAQALEFSQFLAEWNATVEQLKELMEKTNIDRFLLLRAWNGHFSPRWTTSFFQMRMGEQEPFSYVHTEIDQDYIDRLRQISTVGPMELTVDEIPESLIKNIYKSEGVTHSFWCHLETNLLPTGASSITYCSFSTHGDAISDETKTKCHVFAGRLKGIALTFREAQQKTQTTNGVQ